MERPDDGGRGGKDEGGGGTERERRVTLEVEDTHAHTHTHTHTHSSVEEQAATADRFITALKRVGIHFWLQQQTLSGRRTSLFPGCSGCEYGVFSPSCGGYFVLSPLVQLSQHR